MMLSKLGTVKVLMSALVIATTMSPALASSPGYTQTPSNAESTTAMLNPVSSKGLPARRACRLIARVVSAPMPLPGQTSRSSGNFNLDLIRVGESVRVSVVQNGKLNSRITFNIKRDIRRGTDPRVARNVDTGSLKRISKYPLSPVYIADPIGAGRSQFRVDFWRC